MQSTLQYLYSLQKFGMKLGLRNIRLLLNSVGNPHERFKTIHVAGTNGKGSTSSMIAAILTAAGYRVGLYTSPHLVKFNERIRINGKMISDRDIARYTKKLRSQMNRLNATFFEATTAIAFNYFADHKVDVAVIETGLGGRLDSTNVVKPIVSVITSIGKDHTEQLGKTLASIAGEKAGIIKSKVPVVIGNIKRRPRNVILSIVKQKRAPLILSAKIDLPLGIELQLKGRLQIANAKAAVAAVSVVCSHFLIGDGAVRRGLEQTSTYTGLRARFELLKGSPDMLLDVAHNPDGIKTLVAELKKLPYKKFVVVFAVMKDKEYLPMLKMLKRLSPTMIATKPQIERAMSVGELYQIMKSLGMNSYHASMVSDAVALGKKISGKNGLLVITGSHYAVGEALRALKI